MFEEAPTFTPGCEALDAFDQIFEKRNVIPYDDEEIEIPAGPAVVIGQLINTKVLPAECGFGRVAADEDLHCSEKLIKVNNAIPNGQMLDNLNENEKPTVPMTASHSQAVIKSKPTENLKINKPRNK